MPPKKNQKPSSKKQVAQDKETLLNLLQTQ